MEAESKCSNNEFTRVFEDRVQLSEPMRNYGQILEMIKQISYWRMSKKRCFHFGMQGDYPEVAAKIPSMQKSIINCLTTPIKNKINICKNSAWTHPTTKHFKSL